MASPRQASLELAARHPVLRVLVTRHGPCRFPPKPPAAARFETLANAIVSQQLAGAAADTIWARARQAVGPVFTQEAVLRCPPDALRAAGLSGAKLVSIVDLAQHVDDGRLELDGLGRYDDPRVTELLTQVKGIGPWTADMFMIFALHRLDIWPTGDLGVRAGYGRAFGLPAPPAAKELAPLGDDFRPYRSVLAWYCWRAVETKS